MQHEALGAVEHVAGAILARRRRDVGQIVARLPLDMREGKHEVAARDLRQQTRRASHRVPPRRSNPPPRMTVARYGSSASARPNASITIMVSTGAAAEAAVVSRQTAGRASRVRHNAPTSRGSSRRAPAIAFLRCSKRVMVGDQPLDALLQQPLLIGQVESPLSESQNRLGDDVALDLVGAAVDRDLAHS